MLNKPFPLLPSLVRACSRFAGQLPTVLLARARAVDLCDPGPECCCRQPTTFSCSRAGTSRRRGTRWEELSRVNRKMIGGSQGWQTASRWSLLSAFCQLTEQVRVYTLVLCVRMPCRGVARQGWPLCKGCWWHQAARTGQPVGLHPQGPKPPAVSRGQS